MKKSTIAGTLIVVVALAVWIGFFATKRDFAREAIDRAGGDEVVLRRLEDPKGKTPEEARAGANLARSLRDADRTQPPPKR